MYTVKQIAHYIITRCTQCEKPVSNLKLQKMLYFAWVDYYRKTGKYLFEDEICAWQFGPVCPDIYYEYCSYGGMDIEVIYSSALAHDDEEILNDCISRYNDMPVSKLVNLTHEQGKPWDQIYNVAGRHRDRIPFPLIQKLEC